MIDTNVLIRQKQTLIKATNLLSNIKESIFWPNLNWYLKFRIIRNIKKLKKLTKQIDALITTNEPI